MTAIDLPKPLSTNRLFRNKGRGRVCTQEYNTWKWHAMERISKQKPIPKPNGPVRILFAVGETGLRSNIDGDNCLKCLLDALVDNGILTDDSRKYVRGVGMEWVEGKEGATAHIMPAGAPFDFGALPVRGVIS